MNLIEKQMKRTAPFFVEKAGTSNVFVSSYIFEKNLLGKNEKYLSCLARMTVDRSLLEVCFVRATKPSLLILILLLSLFLYPCLIGADIICKCNLEIFHSNTTLEVCKN